LRTFRDVVEERGGCRHQREQQADRLGDALPQREARCDSRLLWQAAVRFRRHGVLQNVDHVGTPDARRIVDARVREAEVIAQLRRAGLAKRLHVGLRAELQTARWTGLDAGRLQSLADAIGTERALVDLFRRRVELWNVEGTPGHA